jgi:hypothetical protein
MADKANKADRVFTLIPGKVAVEACKTPEGARAFFRDIFAALGIEPEDEEARETLADSPETESDSNPDGS